MAGGHKISLHEAKWVSCQEHCSRTLHEPTHAHTQKERKAMKSPTTSHRTGAQYTRRARGKRRAVCSGRVKWYMGLE